MPGSFHVWPSSSEAAAPNTPGKGVPNRTGNCPNTTSLPPRVRMRNGCSASGRMIRSGPIVSFKSLMRFFHQLLHHWLDRLGVNGVALLREVRAVGLIHRAHFVIDEQLVADVEEVHYLSVGQLREETIRRRYLRGIGRSRAIVREQAEHEHLGARQLLANAFQDCRHTVADLIRRGIVVTDVVDADQQHDQFGLGAVECAVVDAPENLLRTVVVDAHLCSVAMSVVFLPDGRRGLPALRERVAEEDEIDFSLGRASAIASMAFEPTFAQWAIGGSRGRMAEVVDVGEGAGTHEK